MAGLFCSGHFLLDYLDSILGVLGFDLGSQSWLPSLPSELHLSSIWDSMASFASFASI